MARYNPMAAWSGDDLLRTLHLKRNNKARAQTSYEAAVTEIAAIEREISERQMEAIAARRAA